MCGKLAVHSKESVIKKKQNKIKYTCMLPSERYNKHIS